MSAKKAAPAKGIVIPEKTLTIDDLKSKAEHIKDVAREDVRRVVGEDVTRVVIAGAVAFAVVVGLAYYAGTRRCPRFEGPA